MLLGPLSPSSQPGPPLAPHPHSIPPADAALDYAVAQAYDQRYGARPLRRWLEHSIVTPLSRMIVGGERAAAARSQLQNSVFPVH